MIPVLPLARARDVRRCVTRLVAALLLAWGGVDVKAAAQERAVGRSTPFDAPVVESVSSQLRETGTTGAAPRRGPVWDRLRGVRAAFGSDDDDARTAMWRAKRDLPKRAFARDVVMSVRAGRP